MTEPRFEWDRSKAVRNEAKHGVTFREAVGVFADESGLLIPDPDHDRGDKRYVLLGLGASLRLLIVCHAYDDERNVVRHISARKATRAERAQYGVRSNARKLRFQ